MEDKETATLWSHTIGSALDGKCKGKQLVMIPSVQTTWRLWFREHPKTLLLRKEKAVKGSMYRRYLADSTRMGIFKTHWLEGRFPGKGLVLGIALGGSAFAAGDTLIKPGDCINVEIGGEPVLLARCADGGARAYIARADGGRLRLNFECAKGRGRRVAKKTRTAKHGSSVTDQETASSWDMETGMCTSGKLKGTTLKSVIVRRAFWFAWSAFYPETTLEK